MQLFGNATPKLLGMIDALAIQPIIFGPRFNMRLFGKLRRRWKKPVFPAWWIGYRSGSRTLVPPRMNREGIVTISGRAGNRYEIDKGSFSRFLSGTHSDSPRFDRENRSSQEFCFVLCKQMDDG